MVVLPARLCYNRPAYWSRRYHMRNAASVDRASIVETVSAAQLGARIRLLRQQRRLTLDALAERSGVSRAMLSKIERGENNPTLVVVVKVALGLGVTTSQLIGVEERREVVLVPKERRMVFRDQDTGFERQLLFPTFEGNSIEFVRHVLPPGVTSGDMPAHKRGAEKYIVVERGRLKVVLPRAAYVLTEGDALYFECDVAHRFENTGEGTCSYYLVISSHA